MLNKLKLKGHQEIKKMVSHVLENRKIKYILISAASLLVIYLAIGSWVNRIYVSKQVVDDAWGIFKQNCDHRVDLLSQWGAFIKQYRPQDPALFHSLATQYQIAKQMPFTEKVLQKKEDLQRFLNLQQAISDELESMIRILAADPLLTNNPNFQILNSDLQIAQSQIIYTAKVLNKNIERYNATLTEIPGRWVNLFLKYPPMFTFSFQLQSKP